jgi:hypothetical protein
MKEGAPCGGALAPFVDHHLLVAPPQLIGVSDMLNRIVPPWKLRIVSLV